MEPQHKKRSTFSGKLGFVLSAAGASVGLGNIWRFPYLAAKYGGGIFLLIYIVLALTFGYTMITAETAIGRMTQKSPVGAYKSFGKSKWLSFGGWINAIIPILIVPYYSVIGGWVIKYLAEYIMGNGEQLAADGYFGEFISSGGITELCFLVFTFLTVIIIFGGVRNGVERVSKFMMPILVVLSVLIAVYSITRPGALEGVKYFLIPNLSNFSWMTVVAAMGQMFYSLSIAMGILITFGSYMKKDVSIEASTENVEIFDTGIAIMAGLMIIPAVFAFSGGDTDTLQAGPSLMFITIPKVFASMNMGGFVGILFFFLVLCAALTSSIALTESAVSTFQDELGWGRKKSTVVVTVIMVLLGTLSSLGYGPLGGVQILGMQFLDLFDFLTNSVMMPIAAIATCLLVSRVMGVKKIEEEMTVENGKFKRKPIFNFMIRYLCPFFAAVILISSVANAFGWISM
jgi:neurotransmitter:Na+ symporter, NSS family